MFNLFGKKKPKEASVIKPNTALQMLQPASLGRLADEVRKLLRNRLWLQVSVGMVLGIGVGLLLNPDSGWVEAGTATTLGEWLALPGFFFLTIIQMIIVPLVFASVVRGIAANQDMEQLKRTGTRLAAFFLLTTIIAALMGIGLGYVFQPGNVTGLVTDLAATADTIDLSAAGSPDGASAFSLTNLPKDLIGVLPDNPLNALVSAEMLQIVIFAFVVAFALVSLAPETAAPLLDLLGATEAVAIAVVRWVMLLAPWAVFGLLARTMIQTGPEVLAGLGVYAAVALLGFLLLFGLYMLLLVVFARRNPISFLKEAREPVILAFSTNSSAATMPLTLETAEKKLLLKGSTARFVIPLGTTVNMTGTALNQGLATIFLAQLSGIDLGFSAVLVVLATIVGSLLVRRAHRG